MDNSHHLYHIAATMLPGIGDILAKNLIAYCGSAEAIFVEKKSKLERIPGIGPQTAAKITSATPLLRAEKELAFAAKNNVDIYFYLDQNYPRRLAACIDAPIVLYAKGTAKLNPAKSIAIVGTRKATPYGKEFTQQLLKELVPYNPTVISGLAYGIDIAAHKASLDCGLPTVGVFAHGLDRIYPATHQKVAQQMLEIGGWISEYPSGTNPDRENFPTRNRIIAGLADATLVVEAAIKGGALITAEIATSYNRDVFAIPGRVSDVYSEGCNKLIYQNKAAILRHAQDLEFYLGWQNESISQQKQVQSKLFIDITKEEEPLADLLKTETKTHVDSLCLTLQLPVSKIVTMLFNLEMKGAVRSHPGKMYEWIGA